MSSRELCSELTLAHSESLSGPGLELRIIWSRIKCFGQWSLPIWLFNKKGFKKQKCKKNGLTFSKVPLKSMVTLSIYALYLHRNLSICAGVVHTWSMDSNHQVITVVHFIVGNWHCVLCEGSLISVWGFQITVDQWAVNVVRCDKTCVSIGESCSWVCPLQHKERDGLD